MLIKKFMPIVKQFYSGGAHCIYDHAVSPEPAGHAQTGLYKVYEDDNSPRFLVDQSWDMDRNNYAHYTDHYRHEGSTVYRILGDSSFKKRCSLYYEVLYVDDDWIHSRYYGVIAKLDGQWRLYIGDSHMFVLDNVDFETAEEAKEYYDTCIKNDPFIQGIIEDFDKDMK